MMPFDNPSPNLSLIPSMDHWQNPLYNLSLKNQRSLREETHQFIWLVQIQYNDIECTTFRHKYIYIYTHIYLNIRVYTILCQSIINHFRLAKMASLMNIHTDWVPILIFTAARGYVSIRRTTRRGGSTGQNKWNDRMLRISPQTNLKLSTSFGQFG